MTTPTSEHEEEIRDAYQNVRSDYNSDTWVILSYVDDGKVIGLSSTGSEYSEFAAKLTECSRSYGYVRIETGDEMSKRAKFAFITWIRPDVSGVPKARVSTDKAFVKKIITEFAKEILTSEVKEIQEDVIRGALEKAGGANYGTGK